MVNHDVTKSKAITIRNLTKTSKDYNDFSHTVVITGGLPRSSL